MDCLELNIFFFKRRVRSLFYQFFSIGRITLKLEIRFLFAHFSHERSERVFLFIERALFDTTSRIRNVSLSKSNNCRKVPRFIKSLVLINLDILLVTFHRRDRTSKVHPRISHNFQFFLRIVLLDLLLYSFQLQNGRFKSLEIISRLFRLLNLNLVYSFHLFFYLLKIVGILRSTIQSISNILEIFKFFLLFFQF